MKPLLFSLLLSVIFIQPLFSQNTLDNAGITSSSPSAIAYSLRKLSSTYTGPAIKVRRSSDNAEAKVAFDGSNAVSATSMVTFTPGVMVSASFGTVQTGTVSSEVSKTGTITIKPNGTGSITATTNSLTVTGNGTSFTTELVAGDRLFNAATNTLIGVVGSISGNTTLLLNSYAPGNYSLVSYKTTSANVTGIGTNFTGELATGDRLFNTADVYLGTVSGITNATTLTLNAEDAVAATGINYNGTSATLTGSGTSFASLTPGDMLISNNITLGIIASIADATTLTLTAKAGGAVSGLAYKSTLGTIAFSTYYNASSVYVNTWYDQSGNNRDAVQLKTTSQPRIVNAGTLYTMGGKTSMEYSTALTSFLQTSAPASWLSSSPYTLSKVTAEATNNPANQYPLSTTGGNGPANTVLHFGYRNSTFLTLAQTNHDHNYFASAGTALEAHLAVKASASGSQFYKNGTYLNTSNNGVASYLLNVGQVNIGLYAPTNVQYNGAISEILAFPAAMAAGDIASLNSNQVAYYSILTNSWTGAVSTDWNNTGNWSAGIVPTVTTPAVVLIPAGKLSYPVINLTTVQANSISIEAGASLIVSGTGNLQLAGTINNLGTCNFTNGTIEYIGTTPEGVAASTFTGSVLNLIINNSAGVTLYGSLTVSGNLTLTTGKLGIYIATLTIGGTVTNTTTGGLRGEPNSSLVINSTVSPTLSFDQGTPGGTNILKNFTINSSGQTVTLANNLIMLGTGTTTFTAGKLAIGSATLTLRGAVVNTVSGGLKGSAASNIIVDGTVSPTLSFDQTTPGTTNALNNFTISAASQTVTLANPLVIRGALALTNGNITTTTSNSLTLTSAVTLTGGASTSYINGPLIRYTNSAAGWRFPLGKTNIYDPVTITPATTAAGVYSAEYFPVNGPAGTYATGVTAIATDEYWNIGKISGPDAQVTLLYNADHTWSSVSPTSQDNIFVAHYNGISWDPVNGTYLPGNTGTGLTAVMSMVMTSFSPFTFGFGANAALPVTLIDFRAVRMGEAVQLTWTTENEISFYSYELERSANGHDFNKIATVLAANTVLVKTYNWQDNAPLTGINYYRLKMLDIDRAFTYSHVVKMDISGKNLISVYPNPVTGQMLSLSFYGQLKGNHIINLYTVFGEKLMSTVIAHDGIDAVKNIYLPANTKNGNFYLEIIDPVKIKKTLSLLRVE